MELTITKQQREYLNKNGPIKAAALQKIYKNSVQDQQKILDQAARIRKAK